MTLDSGVTIDEELVYQNDQTMRIHYRKNDALGTTGYVASSYVDEPDDLKCRLHMPSWFDLAPDKDAEAAVARFEGIPSGIFEGFKLYFSPQRRRTKYSRALPCRYRLLATVVVEPALGLAAEPAGLDVFHE
jgi:hypothetical protein